MSIRVDSSPLIANSFIIGGSGLGVLAEDVPSTGDSGPGYIYNDLSLPADNGKEVRGEITTQPSAGTLFAYEDSSFEFTGAPDGTYTFQYQLYVDGVATGSPATVELQVGATAITASTASVSITTYNAAVATSTNVSASLAAISASTYQASISQSSHTNVTGTLAALSVATFAATVNNSLTIATSFASVDVTAYQSTIEGISLVITEDCYVWLQSQITDVAYTVSAINVNNYLVSDVDDTAQYLTSAFGAESIYLESCICHCA